MKKPLSELQPSIFPPLLTRFSTPQLFNFRMFSSNNWLHSVLTLFSRNDFQSTRIQTNLLKQWAAQPAQVTNRISARYKNTFAYKLLTLMRKSNASSLYRLLAMIVLAALYGVKFEIDALFFAELKNKISEGSNDEYLPAFLFCLNPEQLAEIILIISNKLNETNSTIRTIDLRYLNFLALKLDEATLISFKSTLIKVLSSGSSVEDEAIKCFKTFILRLSATEQLKFCLEILEQLESSSVAVKCLQACKSLLNSSNVKSIISKLFLKIKEPLTGTELTIVTRCISSFSGRMSRLQQEELISIITAKLTDSSDPAKWVIRDTLLAVDVLASYLPSDLLFELMQVIAKCLVTQTHEELAANRIIQMAEHLGQPDRIRLFASIEQHLNNLPDVKFAKNLRRLSSVLSAENIEQLVPKLIKTIDMPTLYYDSLLTLADCLPQMNSTTWQVFVPKLSLLLTDSKVLFPALLCLKAMPAELIHDPLWPGISQFLIDNIKHSDKLILEQILKCILRFSAGFKEQNAFLVQELESMLNQAPTAEVISCLDSFSASLSPDRCMDLVSTLISKLKGEWTYPEYDFSMLSKLRLSAWNCIINRAPRLDRHNSFQLCIQLMDMLNHDYNNKLTTCLLIMVRKLNSHQIAELILIAISNEKEPTNYEHRLVSPLILGLLAPLLREPDLEKIITKIENSKETNIRSSIIFASYLTRLLPILDSEQTEQAVNHLSQNLMENDISLYISTLNALVAIASKTEVDLDLGPSLYQNLQKALHSSENRNRIVNSASSLILCNVSGEITDSTNLSLEGFYVKLFAEVFLKLKPYLQEVTHVEKLDSDEERRFSIS
ncbi:hypothetical protein Lqui_2511 [Legionella quinlivanii]|uniref:Uncharacterized protein n=2 Tax=Legionella quinlivanii TaxID=45073 RepID=A0A0W0XPN6_9GAMM|nr:hypothetical protein Lqui_2511 [Legionella quinlivanii]SEG08656.1 hypothetical protein SAMN02746093_01817 [Legionella quinlivanii DSM 21216]STY10275.1 Uncharacterised protein [Legionella quinlivanii]